MIEKTVVGWDGSAPARAALDWAAEWSSGRDLLILRVLDDSIGVTDSFVADSAAEAARSALAEVVAEVQAAFPAVHVQSEFVRGDPISELRRRSSPESLVVVGTHRRDGAAVRFEWSPGTRLAAHANGPVAIIPMDDGATRSGVVVGVDGSVASDAAVAFAAGEARRTGQQLRIIHAWQEPYPWQSPVTPDLLLGPEIPADPGFLDTLEESHRQILEDAVTVATDAWPAVHVQRTLVRGPAQPALLEAARGATLLVVGNHGRRGVERLLLGSVSHSIALHIPSPTVVVRAAAGPEAQQPEAQ